MIKTWQQRCEEHPDHEGIVTEQMIRERMQEEIDELRQALAEPVDAVNISAERVDKTVKDRHEPEQLSWADVGVTSLPLRPLEQEPVAWVQPNGEIVVRTDYGGRLYYSEQNVYTAPPKREWVGLTEAERIDIIDDEITAPSTEHFALAQTIEAKLKEKNGV